jgi:hypothetical protein
VDEAMQLFRMSPGGTARVTLSPVTIQNRQLLPVHAASPIMQAGRHPRLHFRGLLRLHSRYGPSSCSTAQGGLCHEAPIRPVARPNRSSATRPLGWILPPLLSVPFRGTLHYCGYGITLGHLLARRWSRLSGRFSG